MYRAHFCKLHRLIYTPSEEVVSKPTDSALKAAIGEIAEEQHHAEVQERVAVEALEHTPQEEQFSPSAEEMGFDEESLTEDLLDSGLDTLVETKAAPVTGFSESSHLFTSQYNTSIDGWNYSLAELSVD